MTEDASLARALNTVKFMESDIHRLQAHNKASLLVIDWLLRCGRRHSPLMGRVMQAHFRRTFLMHKRHIEHEDAADRKKVEALRGFCRQMAKQSQRLQTQLQSVQRTVELILVENEQKSNARGRSRNSNAMLRLSAENAALLVENLSLKGKGFVHSDASFL